MATTTYMNLTLPDPTVTLGPQWAIDINAAFTEVDGHDHSDTNGTKIKPNGLDITSDLDFQQNKIINLQAVKYDDQTATQTGSTNARQTYTVNGDLYFTNGSGVAVQLTSGGSLVSSPGAITSYSRQNLAANLVINPADTFTFISVDTTAARQITLPLASAVSDGRFYIIKDKSGNSLSNNITIVAAGSDTIDGQASQILDSNYGVFQIVGDGASSWFIS